MIRDDGYLKYSIWEHSARVRTLYERRCRLEEPEMDSAAQAAELLRGLQVERGETLLDAGCGSGYFFHSLQKRGLPLEYYGIDASPSLVAIGQRCLPTYGLAAERLRVMRIEDLNALVDHVVCLNVLSNIENYHRALERLLLAARKTVLLRMSSSDQSSCLYVQDPYVESDVPLRVYVNCYRTSEVLEFIRTYGFDADEVTDLRTEGRAEMVIDYPHYWKFFVARRREV